jgi:glucose/arabinose dehydrogenase
LDLPVGSNLPATFIPGIDADPIHNGGKLAVGPDGNLYLAIGDPGRKTKASNFVYGNDADGSGGILRITPDGETVGNGILGSTHPLDKYFAYGIRNSYGIDFDPVTGFLWDTENGPSWGDEINLVKPGFNSGWQSVMGLLGNKGEIFDKQRLRGDYTSQEELHAKALRHMISAARGLISGNQSSVNENLKIARIQLERLVPELYDFNRKGMYSDPEFTWNTTVGPTAIQFYNSTMLGQNYSNHMFVGEWLTGRILDLTLNSSRTGLDLPGNLSDGVANAINDTDSILFASGLNGITDIEEGPDGLLYITERNTGTIYKILPK